MQVGRTPVYCQARGREAEMWTHPSESGRSCPLYRSSESSLAPVSRVQTPQSEVISSLQSIWSAE